MKTPLRSSSSEMLTSSERIVSGSILVQLPTREFQPMIEPEIQVDEPTLAPVNKIEL